MALSLSLLLPLVSSCKLRRATPKKDDKASELALLMLLLLMLLLFEVESSTFAPTTEIRVAVAKRSNDTSSHILPPMNVVIAIASKMDVFQHNSIRRSSFEVFSRANGGSVCVCVCGFPLPRMRINQS